MDEYVLFSQTARVEILTPTFDKCDVSNSCNLFRVQVLFFKIKMVKSLGI